MASATAGNVRSRASLLEIASEVRLRIYHFVFHNAAVRVHFRPSHRGDVYVYPPPARSSNAAPPHNGPHQWVDFDEFPDSITRTCQTLRNESLTILHGAAHLYVCTSWIGVSSPDPEVFLASIPAAILPQTRQLSIGWNLFEYAPLHMMNSLEMLMVTDLGVTDWIQGRSNITNDEARRLFENQLRHGPYRHLRMLKEKRVGKEGGYQLMCERYIFTWNGGTSPFDAPYMVGRGAVVMLNDLLTEASVFCLTWTREM